METHIETRNLKYTYSESERVNFSLALGTKSLEKQTLESHKRAPINWYKNQIDGIAMQINQLSTKIQSGCEYRNVECEIEFNYPDKGKKRITRLDTGDYWDEIMGKKRLHTISSTIRASSINS